VSASDDHESRISQKDAGRYSLSLGFGIAILQCYSAERPVLGIAELAQLVKLSRSTTHRYAATLVELGYLEQDKDRRYLLSCRAGGSGMAFVETLRKEIPAARRVLEDLRDATGFTVSLGVLDGPDVLYLYRLFAHGQGQYHADLDLDVGAFVPAYCTAIGKVLLAGLATAELSRTLAERELQARGPETITDEVALAEQLLAIRAVGIAVCNEEQAPGVRSIAAAIGHTARSRPMAVSVTVPAKRISFAKMKAELTPHVLAAAERI
jgi:IclR family pca regulon transcriptional regulator